MNRIATLARSWARDPIARWIGGPVVLAAAVATFISHGQVTSPPAPTPVNLSPEPLYARGARAKPTLTLALSVEFPTVGAQYVSTPGATTDDTYSPNNEYIGYFHAGSCYEYYNGSSATDRYFRRTGAATNRTCTGGFSGNFMNWATSSAIDILRFGLTGGDRVIDTDSLTVLQRAVLPNTGVSGNFWNGSNFPAKILRTTYIAGAVPSSLVGSHTGDIYVANCLNKVHFGTQATGSCATPGNNSNLGTPSGGSTFALGPVSSVVTTLPGTWSTKCADEGGTCTFSGLKEVAYGTTGSGGGWITMPVSSTTGIACSNNMTGTFNDPKPGVVKECRVRDYTGTWTPPSGSTALTVDGFFYSRVRVCESDGSGALLDPRADLCLRYPNGKYKPVGNLQKSADNIRVAAFGYINDASLDRYGGVLRAPMKYVGPRSYDSTFSLSQTANPVQEWDPATGVFARNPDASILPSGTPVSGSDSNWPGQQMSGVINYLNQFGRTGTAGQYKTHDPVGELYYESLRYLQGLPPTSGTTSATSPTHGSTTANWDGFPVYDTWLSTSVPDPHPAVSGMTDYSCIKNNIVAIGDVNTHADKYVPGNTRVSSGDTARAADLANNLPDFKEWTRVVGAFEEAWSPGASYTDGTGAQRDTSNYNTANLFDTDIENASPGTCCNNNSFYMAGMAYWANTHDIRGTTWTGNTSAQRPGMRVKTYILDVNEYGNQSNQTTRRRNQFYLAAKYGGFDDDIKSGRPGRGNPYISYAPGSSASSPSPSFVNDNSSWERVSADAAKREAKTYFLSSSAAEVLASLNQIFADINAQARSIAGGAISTQRLQSDETGYIYQAQFDPTDWSGDLIPVSIAASGTTVTIGDDLSSSPWRNSLNQPTGARGKLDDRVLSGTGADPRNIYVGYRTSDSTPVFGSQEFVWSGLQTSIAAALRKPAYPASAPDDSDTVAEARLNYLRGDRSQEAPAGVFRRRGSRLGDIVNSGVVYSGAPSQAISGSTYATFRSTYLNRPKALFVGANDGMLHAFNAQTGAELFAYIPSWLVPKLSALTHPSYIHQSYQDATPVVGEVNVGSTSSQVWKTVLVAGSGGGGQGVFALDVSNPGSFGNANVLWEFTDRDDPSLGNVIGRPQLLKVNVGSATSPDYRMFAVVASGVNNHVADGSASTGEPALFFLRLDKAKTAPWVEGTSSGANYFKLTFPRTSTALASGLTIASGMVGFTALTGTAGQVTYIYAGDLQGNLWKVDMSAFVAGTAPSIDAFSYYKTASGTAVPMFIAKDAAGNRQPISMEPALAFGSQRSVIVAFGTGKFLEATDNASVSGAYPTQSVYTLLDNNSRTLDSTSGPTAAISGRGRLMAGTAGSTGISVPDFVWGRPTVDDSTVSRSGWYFDFYNTSTSGERQVSNFIVAGGYLVFGSVIPAKDTCSSGDGNAYILSLKSGDGTSAASTVGILGEPFLLQVGASQRRASDTTGRRREQTRYQVILQGSGGSAAPGALGFDVVTWPGRLSWREITNYQDVRNSP